MKRIYLNHEQIKFLDNMHYSKEKLETIKLTITEQMNWLHFYTINAKLLNISFNNVLLNEKIHLDRIKKFNINSIKNGEKMLKHFNEVFKIDYQKNVINNTIEIFNQKNETK